MTLIYSFRIYQDTDPINCQAVGSVSDCSKLEQSDTIDIPITQKFQKTDREKEKIIYYSKISCYL